MPQIDRLSSLVSHFEIHTTVIEDDTPANLSIFGNDGVPEWLVLHTNKTKQSPPKNTPIVALNVDFGGQANPVLNALPDAIEIELAHSTELTAIAHLIVSESKPRRCGGQFALDRLCEFLLVNLLRDQIERNSAESGILAGLAHPNLSQPIVAMHDNPGKKWRLDDLVLLSGMSRSQFMHDFQEVVGKSPMAYLKQWRLTLARNALVNGQRVKEIARLYGYGSGDAFTRAFTKAYGFAPTRFIQSDTQPL
ncbi:MAG: AraC family transcriptional regulator [Pseudomonadota bacterium]